LLRRKPLVAKRAIKLIDSRALSGRKAAVSSRRLAGGHCGTRLALHHNRHRVMPFHSNSQKGFHNE
jgi:hypothetical protein